MKGKTFSLLFIVIVILVLGFGYNNIQTKDEAVSANWSEVLNQYQRRTDLIPNLVSTTKGYASHEEDIFKSVAETRAKIGSINQIQNAPNNPQSMQEYQESQQALSSALSRLLMVVENYPDLKASSIFHDLMVQLEGSENRIAVARGRYVGAVQDYNLTIRRFPGVVIAKLMGYERKQNFQPDNIEKVMTVPTVDFSN